METWRLIPLIHGAGHRQMAIDRWLLEQHRLGVHPPTLRFYTWSPVALSLGYHQRRYPDAWNCLQWSSDAGSAPVPAPPIALVRRPSGGRAVLHQGDLTYAIITSGLSGSRLQAYRTLCEFLIQGWRALGVELDYGQARRGYIHNPNCFGTATIADLVTADGAKLIGSAQLRYDSAILQHGSMRLEPDAHLFKQVFEADLHMPRLNLSLTGEALRDAVMQALIDAAIAQFQINLVEQPLTPSEWQQIDQTNPTFLWRNQDLFSNAH
ncbi:lipoate--protein ligase family protein [Myxacorys almedinensis]|uniref:Lipoate--protein ligase family protein n=1 Tax=Myxacorys almedinensis A TaxID=2690445 RepID=A0A8J8CPL7_9CYAN|nr:biotin/lipoate A/B protein ligase family protein [Myxacorys almedinensis]NDJ19652.1 lipoate--protein ligase family protein [Myxacorys almedinensis A]